ncbi:MAG: ATP-binding cassette domain-containing protein [Bacteroidetes bacterium]|nr:ATP-binding cassette domain-containing protein [Bacteroidota bacterium]HET6246031.1 ATP-binding cassette domain-containing protein [Bacteroidia bacterium]
MSERILKALMQLFAIVAKVDGVSNTGREVVLSFLKQQLSLELVDEYLNLFDEFIDAHHNTTSKKEGARKRTSVNSVKILKICTQINSELTQKQKIVVLIRLIELINAGEITEQEIEFVSTVADTFNIDEQEYVRCMTFVQNKVDDVTDSANVLIIDNNKTNQLENCKHYYSEFLTGQLRILHISSVNMYALRYYGTSELYLNGQPLLREKVHILTQGSSIRSSKVQPIYYSDIISCFMSDTTVAKLTFNVNAIEYRFANGSIGLQHLDLYEESGKLIGIMGGSGAGKSTLLNVLNGNDRPSSGSVTINGFDIHLQKDKIQGVIGYVSQDDLLIEELTVYQNLYYNAKLCFDHLDDRQISKKVLDVLNNLGLYETRNLKVGSPLEKTISGGQRKRVNIALELIREPSVLFVDEPTSGLSSRDSENIMDLLKELALKGKLIFVVIHQPSSEIFKMFDKLLILDLGGYTIYYGNPVDAIIYFKKIVNHVNSNESECNTCGNVNPEQIFNIIESKVVDEYGDLTRSRKISPKEWNAFYTGSKLQNNQNEDHFELPEISFKVPSKIKQFTVFVTRDVLSKFTNKQYMLINMLEAPVLAIILAFLVKYYNSDISNIRGYIFRENENIPAYLFMSVVVALFIGLTVSAEEIIRDRKILKRESFLNLSKGSYLFSKIGIMFLLSSIQTLTFILIANFILELRGMTFEYWLILFSTACFANMLGLNISSAFNSAVTIYILIPFLLIPQLLLSGVIVKFEKLNPYIAAVNTVPLTGEVMVSRWAFEALAVTQFKDNNFEKEFYAFDKNAKNAEFKKIFWISKIKSKIDFVENNFDVPEKAEQVTRDINLLKNEFILEQKLSPEIEFDLSKIKLSEFGNPTVVNTLRSYTDKLNSHYMKSYNHAEEQKDRVIMKMTSTAETKEEYINLQNNYKNDNLSDLVTNRAEINKILEKNDELIQRSDPVYLDPVKSGNIRAHFFAPRKKIFGKYIDTFWMNVLVIWVMSFILAITLYFDVFRKTIKGIEYVASLAGRGKGR